LPIFASFHFTPRRTFSKKDVDGIERKSSHKIGCRSEPQLLIGRLAGNQEGNQDMSIFGAAFDASTDRWIAFNEETLAALSEHDTEVEALEACRRYSEREMPGGHELSQADVTVAQSWWNKHVPATSND
jgi:hypothetical protein